jgi:long-chain acyl-CoA synthetase
MTLRYEQEMKITDSIYESLANWGEHPVFIELSVDGTPVYTSAGDFKARIDEIKAMLHKAGIRKNYIVALFLKNSADFAAILFALMDIGAMPIPVNLAFRKMELDEIFLNADPHAIIAESDHLPVVKPYTGDTIVVERKNGKLHLHHQGNRNAHSEPADIDETIASINYTYRGYGYPLGAMVPHTQYLHGAKVLVDGLQPEPGENMLVLLPFTYIFPLIGCLYVPLLYHITSVLSCTMNPLNLFGFINKYKINIITAVTEIYELIFNLKDESMDLSSLKVFVSGGSLLSEDQYGKIKEAFKVEYLHGYGLTEFTPVSRNMRREGRAGTIGPLCDGVECMILSPDQKGQGEIALKISDMTKGYYRKPKETADAIDGGWFRTGDIGTITDGHLIFVKEKKKTRKVKGNMVDLEEVRKVLMSYPQMQEVTVECSNNLLSANIRIDSRKNFEQESLDIKKFLEDKIARYKIPKNIHLI